MSRWVQFLRPHNGGSKTDFLTLEMNLLNILLDGGMVVGE